MDENGISKRNFSSSLRTHHSQVFRPIHSRGAAKSRLLAFSGDRFGRKTTTAESHRNKDGGIFICPRLTQASAVTTQKSEGHCQGQTATERTANVSARG